MRRRAPRIADAGIRGGWAGLYEMTPDHNAIIGEAAGVSRFLYATGFSGHGFLQGPAVGEILRDMVLRRPTFVDIAPLRSSASTPPRCARSTTSSSNTAVVEITPTTATGATRLVEMLEQLEVELVFGLPGVHNLPIWKALSESDIRLVSVRHEQTAAYAADGYARATGRLGVALVTTGPGRSQHARRHRRGDGGGLAGARDRHRHIDRAPPRRRLPRHAARDARPDRRCSGRSRRPRG